MLCRFVFLLCCCSMVVQAEVTLAELQQIQRQPELVVDELSQLKPADRDAIHWYKLSRAYLALQQKDAALLSVDKALALGLEPADTVQALEHKAMVYGRLFRNNPLAIAALIQAEQQLTKVPSAQKPQLQTSLYESFAQAYNQQGNITEAIRYAELSIAIATEHQLPAAELPARLIAGRLALQQNHFALTQLHLDRALTLALALGNTESLVSIHTRLAMAYRKLDQFNQALDHAASALQLLSATSDRNFDQSIAIRLWLLQADSYQQLGDQHRSADILQQANQAAQRLQDPHYLALVYHGQAQLAVSKGELPQAKAFLTQALQLLSQIDHQSQLQEIQLAYVDVALAQQDWDAAAVQFPEFSTLADAPEFLQQRYWELLARLRAGQLRWQEAYVATQQAATLQNQQWQSQQKSTVDLLNQRLVQQQLTSNFEQSQQHNRLLTLLSLVLAAFLSLMAVLFFPRRHSRWQAKGSNDHRGASPLAQVSSWAEFSQQLHREQQKSGSLYLQCIQLAEPQQLKLAGGEQLLRQHWQQLLNTIPEHSLAAVTIDSDAIWLVWRTTDQDLPALLQPVHSTLRQQQAEFASSPAIFSFVAPLQPLLGTHWRIADLAGIRELIWLSWQLATDQQRGQRQYLLYLSCPQPLPCSWQTTNVRLDISNALRLGLIALRCNDLPLASP